MSLENVLWCVPCLDHAYAVMLTGLCGCGSSKGPHLSPPSHLVFQGEAADVKPSSPPTPTPLHPPPMHPTPPPPQAGPRPLILCIRSLWLSSPHYGLLEEEVTTVVDVPTTHPRKSCIVWKHPSCWSGGCWTACRLDGFYQFFFIVTQRGSHS